MGIEACQFSSGCAAICHMKHLQFFVRTQTNTMTGVPRYPFIEDTPYLYYACAIALVLKVKIYHPLKYFVPGYFTKGQAGKMLINPLE